MNIPGNNLSPLISLLNNEVLFWALIACGLAQISKLFIELVFHQSWRPSVLLETGGMPSSHSALVTGAAAGVGWQIGFGHPDFALAVTVAFIVMYDASGIRRSAGLTASRVNLISELDSSSPTNEFLKENLGHTRAEVLVGSLLGPTIALPGIVFLGSPLHLIQILQS